MIVISDDCGPAEEGEGRVKFLRAFIARIHRFFGELLCKFNKTIVPLGHQELRTVLHLLQG